MAPADACFTIEQYNARHFREPGEHLDPGKCLRELSAAAAEDVRRRVGALRASATHWGRRYWEKKSTARAERDIDSEIIAEMAAAHPGFSPESLTANYHTGIMLAR